MRFQQATDGRASFVHDIGKLRSLFGLRFSSSRFDPAKKLKQSQIPSCGLLLASLGHGKLRISAVSNGKTTNTREPKCLPARASF